MRYEVKNYTLRDELALLLLDRLEFSNTTAEFHEALLTEFEKDYPHDDINDELEVLFIENKVKEAMDPYSNMPSFLYGAIIPDDFADFQYR